MREMGACWLRFNEQERFVFMRRYCGSPWPGASVFATGHSGRVYLAGLFPKPHGPKEVGRVVLNTPSQLSQEGSISTLSPTSGALAPPRPMPLNIGPASLSL